MFFSLSDSGVTGFNNHSQTPCPLRAPLVVTIVGLPCRGKSFAAHKVARHLCWKGELAKGKYTPPNGFLGKAFLFFLRRPFFYYRTIKEENLFWRALFLELGNLLAIFCDFTVLSHYPLGVMVVKKDLGFYGNVEITLLWRLSVLLLNEK